MVVAEAVGSEEEIEVVVVEVLVDFVEATEEDEEIAAVEEVSGEVIVADL